MIGRCGILCVLTLLGIGAAASAELTVPTKPHRGKSADLPRIQASEPQSDMALASTPEQKVNSRQVPEVPALTDALGFSGGKGEAIPVRDQ